MRKLMFGVLILALGALVIIGIQLSHLSGPEKPNREEKRHKLHTLEVLSKIYPLKTIYKSMEGPSSSQNVVLMKDKPPELLWITGYRAIIVGADGKTPMNQEFICHNNLGFKNMWHHRQLFRWTKNINTRMFTLSQGQYEINFPEGFGYPVMSDEQFRLGTQVLNLNVENPDLRIRHKVMIDYIRDKDLDSPMRPLFSSAAFVMALLEGDDGYYGIKKPTDAQIHASCMPGLNPPQAGNSRVFQDPFGRKFTGHWVVKPGREVRRTLVTRIISIPFDTTIHYIALHIHPFAESLELRDLTTQTTVFKSYIKGPKDRIGVSKLDYYSSKEGLPVYKDHEYEMVSVYNNTTPVNQDAMATMFFYYYDKEFNKGLSNRLSDMRPDQIISTALVLAGIFTVLAWALRKGRPLSSLSQDGRDRDVTRQARIQRTFLMAFIAAGVSMLLVVLYDLALWGSNSRTVNLALSAGYLVYAISIQIRLHSEKRKALMQLATKS